MSVETNLGADTFSNSCVNASSISIKHISLQALSPKYRRLNLAWGFGLACALTIILLVLSANWFFQLPDKITPFVKSGYVIIALITTWNMLYHFLADPIKKYALREHDLNYQSGLLFRSLVSQPVLRIQHIEIKRGPLERKMGLATLQVFSAGGVSHTFTIPGLEYETAVALRQFILEHKDLAADA